MSAEAELQRLLADTDAALPPPPARGVTAAALEQRLARRRLARLAAGTAVLALALGAAWVLRTRPTLAAPLPTASAERALLVARLDRLLARVDSLRTSPDPEPDCRMQLAVERAAAAGAQCAASLEAFDPAAAARQRAQIAALHPDTFAARNLPAASGRQEHPPEEHR